MTNAGTDNTDYLYAYIYAEGETDTDNPAKVLATMKAQIQSGTAASLFYLMDEDDVDNWGPTDIIWSGTGGTTYDIYIYTADESNTPEGHPPSKQNELFPDTVTIDGNQVIPVDYGTMVQYPQE